MIRARAVLAVSVLAACRFGPRADSFVPATHPAGVEAALDGRDAAFSAELLAVSDTGLLLLRERTLVYAPYHAIRHATFRELSEEVVGGAPPDSAGRTRLRLVSRFPQGASPERLRSLLAAHHQDSLVVLKP